MHKFKFEIWTKNIAQEWSRRVLIDYANMLNVLDATKTLKNMKKMV